MLLFNFVLVLLVFGLFLILCSFFSSYVSPHLCGLNFSVPQICRTHYFRPRDCGTNKSMTLKVEESSVSAVNIFFCCSSTLKTQPSVAQQQTVLKSDFGQVINSFTHQTLLKHM